MKRTHEQFILEVSTLSNDDYIVLDGIYKNAHTKITFKHVSCGHEFEKSANNFLTKGQRCPRCARKKANDKKRKTHEKFVKEMFDIFGDEFVVRGEYINDSTKIEVVHTPCNSIIEKRPNALLKGSKCPKCSRKAKKNTIIFKEEVFERVGDEYTVTGEYVRNDIDISMIHQECGKEFSIIPVEFLRGQRCSNCKNKRISLSNRWSHERFVEEVFSQAKGEYSVDSKYTGSHNLVKFTHHTCGSTYETLPYIFLQGSRCPRCMDSKGVLKITSILDDLGIRYRREYKIDNCRYKRVLPFDVALLRDDNSLSMLIEYDGEQHFKEMSNWGGREAFEGIKLRDGIKDRFCEYNNIPLLRIKYTDFDRIEEILTKELSARAIA
jgi:hypothetical protein